MSSYLPGAVLALSLSIALGSGRGTQVEDENWELQTPAPAIPLQSSVGEPQAEACAGCHAEVTREWQSSAHGLAWNDDAYKKSLKRKRRRQLCYGCHAPEPLLAEETIPKKPKARDDLREHGVACESCHQGPQGEMLGSRGTQVDAHVSLASPVMSTRGSNELCSACHSTTIGPVIGIAKDFETSNQAERGRSCVGCHMALVERAWADGEGVPLRTGRSHALQTPRDPAFLRRAFALRTEDSGGNTRLVIANAAGHRVPGLVGRTITFTAQLLDTDGETLEERELKLDTKAYLPVDGEKSVDFATKGASVHIDGLHHDPRSKQGVSFLDETLETP